MRQNRWDKSGQSDRRQVKKSQTYEGKNLNVREKRMHFSKMGRFWNVFVGQLRMLGPFFCLKNTFR